MRSPKTLIIFPQFHIAVCDEKGEQIPELQQPLYELWAQHAVAKGYDPNNIQVITRGSVERLVKSEEGWRLEPFELPSSGGVSIRPGRARTGPAETPPPLTDIDVIDAMEKYGGFFVKSLAQMARTADPINLFRVKSTWPEYWTQYVQMAMCPPKDS